RHSDLRRQYPVDRLGRLPLRLGGRVLPSRVPPQSSALIHVLPVPDLSLGHPRDRRVQPTPACLFAFGLGPPLDIVLLVGVGEFLEGRERLPVPAQGVQEIARDLQFPRTLRS